MDRFSYVVVQTGNSGNVSNQPYQLTLHFKEKGHMLNVFFFEKFFTASAMRVAQTYW